jgi:hypothetical protein
MTIKSLHKKQQPPKSSCCFVVLHIIIFRLIRFRHLQSHFLLNVYIGLLMLKAMLDLNDDEAFEEIMFDIRFQYALRTTSFEQQ